MNEPLGDDPSAPPLALARQVDAVCARFEAVWQSGGRPRLEDYLAGATEPERTALLHDLIPLEVEYRYRGGEGPWAEAYLDQFPDLDPQWLASALRMLRLSAMQGEDGHSKHPRGDLGPASVFPSPDQDALPPGDTSNGDELRVPGYQILGELGRGGMGVVYRGRQVSLDRVVALKMVLAGGHGGPEQWSRFQAEALAVARLDHPHIVRIHEVGRHAGCPFIALEYCPGGTLADHFHGQPQPVGTAAELVRVLAGAVQHAHVHGVVHRDLKPANVLLGSDGRPKITDFGLAKILGASVLQTQTGLILGTPMYMAPEQAAGRAEEIGPATDVYALGAILYEALTGRPPFRAATVSETLEQVKGQEPVSVRHLQPKVPRDLETICQKCLQKEPARRYATAAGLEADLGRFLAGEPILARPVRRVERLGRWCRRNPMVAGLVAGIALVLVLGTAVSSYFAIRAMRDQRRARDKEAQALASAQRADREMHRANQAAQTATEESDRARAAEQEARQLLYARSINLMQAAWDTEQISRLQTLLGETEAYPDKGFEWYYWQRLCHLDLHTLIGHRAEVTSVSWSPDGTRLATGSWDGTAKVWDAASGRERLTLRGHTGRGLVRVLVAGRDAAGDRESRMARRGCGTRPAAGSCSPSRGIRARSVPCPGRRTGRGWRRGVRMARRRSGTRPAAGNCSPSRGIRARSGPCPGRRTGRGWRRGAMMARRRCGTRPAAGNSSPSRGIRAWSIPCPGRRTGRGWRRGVRTARRRCGTRPAAGSCSPSRGIRAGSCPCPGRRTGRGWRRGVRMARRRSGTRPAAGSCSPSRGIRAGSSPCPGRRTGRGWRRGVGWDGEGVGRGRRPRTGSPSRGIRVSVNSVSWSPDGTRLATGSARWHGEGVGRGRRPGTPHPQGAHGSRSIPCPGRRTGRGWRPGVPMARRRCGTRPAAANCSPSRGIRARQFRVLVAGRDAAGDRESRMGRRRCGTRPAARNCSPSRGIRARSVSVSWSPDGKRLATGSEDGTAKVWDAAGGRELLTLKGHTGQVWSVSWSPDGTRLATGSEDGTAKVWDAAGGRELLTLKGHTGRVRSVSWSPDGTRLATGSADGTAKVWDAAGGRELLTLKGHTGRVRSVSWSPDGTRLATGSRGWHGEGVGGGRRRGGAAMGPPGPRRARPPGPQ